jgi:hypothetical protein
MSRFADPSAVAVVPLGACQCPGTPHELDEATVRWDLGSSALGRIGLAEQIKVSQRDPLMGHRQLLKEAVVSWNLLLPGDNGKPVPAPIILAVIAELDDETVTTLATEIDRLIAERGTLPNDSGAPSPASPRGSASPAQKPRRKRGT